VVSGDISDTLPKLEISHPSKIWIENRKYGFVEIVFQENFARVLFHASDTPHATAYKVFTINKDDRGYSTDDSLASSSVSATAAPAGSGMPRQPLLGTPTVDAGSEPFIQFAVLGDWGHPGEEINRTAKLLKKYYDTEGLDAVLLLGDSFYPRGISKDLGVDDPQFRLFTDVLAGGIDESLKFYTVLGNHDLMGSVEAQIAYRRIDKRWNLPSRFYRKDFTSGGMKVCVWFLDTNDMNEDQIGWFTRSLSLGPCTWKFVTGHHPMFTAGEYSSSNRLKNLRDILLPVFRQFNVDVYFSGHEHQTQVLRDSIDASRDKPVFVITGSTAERRDPNVNMIDNCLWVDPKTIGFPFVQITPTEVSIQFRNAYAKFESSIFKVMSIQKDNEASNSIYLV
jgi:3',5'-cyclic AMP phosphodiesterase CpdA